ncbi:MAG: ERCC4 domain-containing protein [Candidatus Micrarchaeaceae archaeon]
MQNRVKIIIDNRERNFEMLDALSNRDVAIEVAQLPVGDYIVSDRTCIERKSASDFESSIMNARIFDQLERMKKSFSKPILLIELSGGFRLSKNVILGAILKAYLDYGVQVIVSEGPAETAEIIEAIARREQNSRSREPRLVGTKKAYTTLQWQLLILESVQGVGPKLAKELLKKFKSIRNVANASIEELESVDKIGPKKAETIHSILNTEYDAEVV